MNTLFLIISAIYLITSNDAASLPKDEQKFVLRGRAVFSGASPILLEPDSKLIVELVDTSLADASSKVIAQGTGKAIRFPMAFAIKYSSKQIFGGVSYSLRVYIKNKDDKVLYTNDAPISIKPIGLDRTKLIDVPVKLACRKFPGFERRRWPDLVGKNGQDAVNIIKKETGFTNVVIIPEGTPVTKDLRWNRVRVYVDKKGIVTRVPNNA